MHMTLFDLLKNDRAVVLAVLILVTVVTWTYTVLGVGMSMSAWAMTGMPLDMPMPPTDWTPTTSILMFMMWWVMMVAMMLPSAAPMLLLYARVAKRDPKTIASTATGVFAAGYLAIWGAFSVAATALHAAGEWTGLVNGMMASSSWILDGVLLMAAGIWQLTPMKLRCLEACRSPIEFLCRIWRPGNAGAFFMGVRHGVFCVGCCWALMLLLFYGGVMNLFWIGGLALLVLAEKVAPRWSPVGTAIGIALIGAGAVRLALA